MPGSACGSANSRSTGPLTTGSTPVDGEQRLAGVARPAGAAQRQLAQTRRAEPRQLDRAAHRDEGLVGADVGRRLLPADVLLAGAQRGHVAGGSVRRRPSRRRDGRAGAGRARAGRRTGRRRARRTTAACRTAGPRRRRRRRRARPARASSPTATGSMHDDQQRPGRVGRGPGGGDVLDHAEVVRVLDHDGAGRRRRRPLRRPRSGRAARSSTAWPVPRGERRARPAPCGD